jgi:hypothetical protein
MRTLFLCQLNGTNRYYQAFELAATLPGIALLNVSVMEKNVFGFDSLLGTGIIDLENRWYVKAFPGVSLQHRKSVIRCSFVTPCSGTARRGARCSPSPSNKSRSGCRRHGCRRASCRCGWTFLPTLSRCRRPSTIYHRRLPLSLRYGLCCGGRRTWFAGAGTLPPSLPPSLHISHPSLQGRSQAPKRLVPGSRWV